MSQSPWLHLAAFGLFVALAQQGYADPPQKIEKDSTGSPSVDLNGDSLPEGAIARTGSVRGRHPQAVAYIAFLPGGKNVLTVCQDQLTRVWDVKSGKEIRRFGESPKPIQEANVLGLPARFRSAMHAVYPFHACLSADGKLLACGGRDGPMRIWDVDTGKELHQINAPGLKLRGGFAIAIPGSTGVSNLALSPDGKVVAGTAMDGTVHLWATSNAKEIKQIAQPENQNMPMAIGSDWGPLAFSPDGKKIIDTHVDLGNGNISGSLRLWDVETGKKTLETKDQDGGMGMFKVAFSSDGKILACSSVKGTTRLLDVATGQELGRLKGLDSWVSLVFLPDAKTLLTHDLYNRSVKAWDVKSGRESRTLIKESSRLHSFQEQSVPTGAMALSGDGRILALAQDHALRILDTSTGKDMFPQTGSQAAVSRVCFLSDGSSLATMSNDGAGRIWETTTGKEMRSMTIPLVEEGAMAVDWTVAGQRYAVGMMTNQIHICDATNGKNLYSLNGNKTGFSALAFSPDGKVLAVREMVSPLIHIHDVTTGKEIRRLEAPPGGVAANQNLLGLFMHASLGLTFSPDGKRLATPIDEKSIGIWNVDTGKQVGPYPLPGDVSLHALSFSPDNRTLALAAERDGVMVVEIASNQIRWELGNKVDVANPLENLPGVIPPVGGAMPIMSSYAPTPANLVFSPDGKILSHGRSDQRIAFWELATGREIGLVKSYQGAITSLAFSPNGKQLASAGSDSTGLVWDLTKILPPPEVVEGRLSEKDAEVCWVDLAGSNAAKAYKSICRLESGRESTVDFLSKNLKPAQVVPGGRIEKLITELDDRQFDVRQKASSELERLGELAAPAARKTLQGKPSAETRRRLEQLLSTIDGRGNISNDRLQTIRAVEVLERIGTSKARQLLQALADGAPGALQTEEAKGSLGRLGKEGP